MRGVACPAALLCLVSCIRSPAELPPVIEGGTVSGLVVEQDLTSGDLRGAEGAIIVDLSTNRRVTADDRGFFKIDRLPVGRRVTIEILRSVGPGLARRARRLAPISILVDGQIVDLGEIRLGENGGIEGEVLLATDALPVGAGGSLVVVAQTAYKGVTSADGSFLIPSVPEGRFEVVAFRPGFQPARASGVLVTPASTTKVRQLVMAPGEPAPVSLNGQAFLEGREDHVGIEVRLIDELDPSVEIGPEATGADGAFAFSSVPIGVYSARFSAEGFGSIQLSGVAVLPEGVIGLLPVTLSEGGGVGPAGDRDGDGCPDAEDAFPDNPFGCYDTDGDGIPNSIDPDDDGDTLSDFEELSPGLDGFVTDPLSPNTDGDAFDDAEDNCPTIANDQQLPTDCAANMTGRLPPAIDGFDPTTGKIGDVVTIQGRNFFPGDLFNAVQFGTGAVATASVTTETTMVVAVPPRARSGPLSVLTGGLVATSSDSFTFIEPPTVLRVAPPSARVGGGVAVYGERVDSGALFVAGVGFPGRVCSQEELDARRTGEGVPLCATVPDGAASGPLQVRSPTFGPSQEAITFVVLSGPVITEVRPNVGAVGDTVFIIGDGFDTSDTGGMVQIQFAGAAAVMPVPPQTQRLLEVVVPAGAETGPVTVLHPAGDAVSPRPFLVDDNEPVVLGASPRLIMEGDTLTITGRNLGDTTAVELGGGVVGGGLTVLPGQLTVTVPVGVQPGEITVRLPTGDIQSPFRLSVLQQTSTGMSGSFSNGLAVSADESTLFAIDSATRDLAVWDIAGSNRADVILQGIGNVTFFSPAPRGDRGLIVDAAAETVTVVALPSGANLGVCPISPRTNNLYPYPFDDTERYAYLPRPNGVTSEGFIRVDLDDPTTCGYVITEPNQSGLGLGGLVFDPATGGLYAFHNLRGQALLDAVNGSLRAGWSGPGFVGSQLHRGLLGATRLYASASGIRGFDALTDQPIQTLGTTPGFTHQTRSGRWLMVIASTNTAYFVDLASETVARENVGPVSRLLAVGGTSGFFVDTDGSAATDVAHFRILD